MLSREFSIAVLERHDDLAEGGPLELAYDAVIVALGWDALTDEALSLMATELVRASGLAPSAPFETTLSPSQRRH